LRGAPQRAFEIGHQGLQPLSDFCALRLACGMLLGTFPDLLDCGIHLVGGGLLLLGGQDRVLHHRRGGAHELADLTGLVGALLRRHDRRIGLVADSRDDGGDRLRRLH